MYYYFAYGSNMNFNQLEKRCLGFRFIKRAFLSGYKFVYDGYSDSRKSSVGNIVKSNSNIVWGGLFELNDNCLKTLDNYEGYPNSYDRSCFEVQDDQGNNYLAVIYFREPQKVDKPSNEYKNAVVIGAKNCGLPEEYINNFLNI